MPELTGESVQPAVTSMPYAEPDDLFVVRGFVRLHALALGLPANRADLLTLAVNELATNTLRHTSGGGRVRLWAEAGQLVCEVADGGVVPSFGAMPGADSTGGRGLPIVASIADEVSRVAVDGGTAVLIRMSLSD